MHAFYEQTIKILYLNNQWKIHNLNRFYSINKCIINHKILYKDNVEIENLNLTINKIN